MDRDKRRRGPTLYVTTVEEVPPTKEGGKPTLRRMLMKQETRVGQAVKMTDHAVYRVGESGELRRVHKSARMSKKKRRAATKRQRAAVAAARVKDIAAAAAVAAAAVVPPPAPPNQEER